ncbi:MAG TPA: TatD family hydrolase [Spirochaetota bacterium]|nr:TatD family hydrolase [Spirochaetota bacterium]
MILDSHAHFDLILEQKGITETDIINNLKSTNVRYAVQVSIEPRGFKWSRDFAERNTNNGIFYTIGIHPSSKADNTELESFSAFTAESMQADSSKLLLGIGECGLDYYRMHQPRDLQIRSFEHQIDVAQKYSLPLIIHLRQAMDEGLEILKRKNAGYGIMHCFAGDSAAAKRVADAGFMVSFAGNLTYKAAVELHDAAAYLPLDMLLLETDSPFLSPVPLRGKPNVPWNVLHTYKFISELKKVPVSRIEDAVAENFLKLVRS